MLLSHDSATTIFDISLLSAINPFTNAKTVYLESLLHIRAGRKVEFTDSSIAAGKKTAHVVLLGGALQWLLLAGKQPGASCIIPLSPLI
jgi:hypothetical protein